MDDRARNLVNGIIDAFADLAEAQEDARNPLPIPANQIAVDTAVNSLLQQLDDGQPGASWPTVSPGQCLVSTRGFEKKGAAGLNRVAMEKKVRKFVTRHAGGEWLPPVGLWFDGSDRLTLDVNHVFTSIRNSMIPPREALLTAVLNAQASVYFAPANGSDPADFKIPAFSEYRNLVLGPGGGKFILDFIELNR